MLSRTRTLRFMSILGVLLSVALMACSGGGGGGGSSKAPQLTVVPPGPYNFGVVTEGNSAQSLQVVIRNDGNADLNITGSSLDNTTDFKINYNGGSAPCGSATGTLAAGESCTVVVDYTPVPVGPHKAVLTITSNDPTRPNFQMSLQGSLEAVQALNVTINQIDACPRAVGEPVTAYVSVTDQGGFPVDDLTAADFALLESGAEVTPSAISFVQSNSPISVSILMDNSWSIAQEPANITAMENAAIGFVQQLRDNDEAEIVKYATTAVVTSPGFSGDHAVLTAAIQATPDLGGGETRLYDTLIGAVDRIAARTTTERRAIIIITDGEDDNGSGSPLSTAILDDVIADAQARHVPVFTVGLGARVNPVDLQLLADETGGTYSDSATAANLATIYQQLAELLFANQYRLTYPTALGGTVPGNLRVTVTYTPTGATQPITDFDVKDIPACSAAPM